MKNFWRKTVIRGLWLCLVSSGFGCRAQSNSPQGEIDRLIAKAKQSGQLSITIPSPMVYRPTIRSIDDISSSSIVIAQPVAVVVVINARRDDVFSWYKFRIDRDLSKHPAPEGAPQPYPGEKIPAALLPILPGEFVLRDRGGTIVIDGIRISSGNDPSQYLKLGRNYLLFVVGLKDGYGVAGLISDRSSSVLALRDDGEHLDPIYKDETNATQADILNRFHGSVSELAQHVKERP